jgi:hypothetical protein
VWKGLFIVEPYSKEELRRQLERLVSRMDHFINLHGNKLSVDEMRETIEVYKKLAEIEHELEKIE